MPRLVIQDGYTLDAKTDDTILQNGKVLYANLPIVTFNYRPALPDALASWRYKTRMAASGEAEVTATAQFVCDHLVSWDAQDANGATVPIRAEMLRKVPEPILDQIAAIVSKWAPKAEESAANLPSGSGSPS
jgi:hypothetical protein